MLATKENYKKVKRYEHLGNGYMCTDILKCLLPQVQIHLNHIVHMFYTFWESESKINPFIITKSQEIE